MGGLNENLFRLGRAWGWFSTIVTIVSLISIIDDLRAWAALLGWLSEHTPTIIVQLANSIANVLRYIATPWHALSVWFLQFLPWQLPSWAFSFLVIIGMAVSGSFRVMMAHRAFKRTSRKRWSHSLRPPVGNRFFWNYQNAILLDEADQRERRVMITFVTSMFAVVLAVCLLALDYFYFPPQ